MNRAAAVVVLACIAFLLADYVTAPAVSPAPKSATAARLARKSRDAWLAWILIAASAAFLASAKPAPRRPAKARPVPQPAVAQASACPVTEPPPLDLSFVETAVALHGRGRESAIPLLAAIQTHYRYLPDEALRRLCELTAVTPAQIAGTSSFYGQFRRSPVGEHLVRVCHGTACHVSGARQITEELRRYLAIPDGADTDPSRTFTVGEVACLGCCSLAPVMMVDGRTAGKLTPASARDALKS
ncbi:MAG: NAD(P)H-dependent oxidoreductase subunit E [Bryobacteraceae bacterium]